MGSASIRELCGGRQAFMVTAKQTAARRSGSLSILDCGLTPLSCFVKLCSGSQSNKPLARRRAQIPKMYNLNIAAIRRAGDDDCSDASNAGCHGATAEAQLRQG